MIFVKQRVHKSHFNEQAYSNNFAKGSFWDRPAFSLHGGEEGRLDSQVGGTCLIMEEGGETFSVIPEDDRYSDDWKNIKQWTVPRIIDTLSDIPWEAYKPANGVLVKRLVDDQVRGFRARIWQIPAGWKRSAETIFGRAYYHRQAHQFNFVLNGDIRIQAYQTPEKKAEEIYCEQVFLCRASTNEYFRNCKWKCNH